MKILPPKDFNDLNQHDQHMLLIISRFWARNGGDLFSFDRALPAFRHALTVAIVEAAAEGGSDE